MSLSSYDDDKDGWNIDNDDDFEIESDISDSKDLEPTIAIIENTNDISPSNKQNIERYRRIDSAMDSVSLAYVGRVLMRKDTSYSMGLSITLLGCLFLGFATYRVDLKHHYLVSLTVALAITGLLNAILNGIQYNILRSQESNAFSEKMLSYIPFVEVISLTLVAIAMIVAGWGPVLPFIPLGLGAYDFIRIYRNRDTLAFASTMLHMAGELAVLDGELAPASKQVIKFTVIVHTIFLILWTGVFVDVAAGTSNVSIFILGFLFFALYWISQTLRSFLSYYVTGTTCFKVGLTEEIRNVQPSVDVVQKELISRGLTICSGSIAAGGLLIGLVSLCWGFFNLTRSIITVFTSKDSSQTMDQEGVVSESTSSTVSAWKVSINRYGWGRVALSGMAFRSGCREEWKLLRKTGVIRIIDQDNAEACIQSFSWIFGALTSLFALVLLPPNTQQTSEILLMFFIVAFFLGAANASIMLEPLRSAIGAVYIAYAENPDGLAADYPVVHHRFMRLSENKEIP